MRGKAVPGREEIYAEHTWGRRSGAYRYQPARCLRTTRWKYIRNFTRQPAYVDNGFLSRFVGDDAGRAQIERLCSRPSPPEELYDVGADPHELTDLAGDPAHAGALRALRDRLGAFLEATDDPILRGHIPNAAGMPDVPQWVEQADGTFRLDAADPRDPRELPFSIGGVPAP
jgi:arylsulfatase A-like enzyme